MSYTGIDASRVIEYFRQYPGKLRERLLKLMQAIGIDLQGYIRINKLQGQVLGHRSGWLSSHVIAGQPTEVGNRISVVVGINTSIVPYAAIHEFGFHGEENVKAHTRTVKGKEVSVRAFTRVMNMPERSYMRSSLQDRRALYVDWIRGTLRASA